jgi:hypothetical protein
MKSIWFIIWITIWNSLVIFYFCCFPFQHLLVCKFLRRVAQASPSLPYCLFLNQPWDIVGPQKIAIEPGMVAIPCDSSDSGGRGRRITSWRPAQAKLARPYLKKKIKQKGWRQ